MHETHADDPPAANGPNPADAIAASELEPTDVTAAGEPEPIDVTGPAPAAGRRIAPRSPDEIADELLRRRFAVSRKAAVRSGTAAAALAVLAVLVGIGLQQAYTAAPPSARRPTATTSATSASAVPTTAAPDTDAPAPPGSTAPATLDANGVIHRPDGPPVRIPLPADTRAMAAVRVAAGWIVRTSTDDPLAMHLTVLLGDDGRLRDFTPRLAGAQTAVQADGRAMAAYLHPHLYVYDLPSGRERTRLDVRTAARGNQVHDMWLTGDRLLVSWGVLEGAHPGAISGLATYDLTTGTTTVTEDVLVADVSGDGRTVLLTGEGSCVRVARMNRAGPLAGMKACLPGRTVLRAALSPDGSLVALTLGDQNVPASEVRLRLFRTADLAAGRVSELAGHDGPPRPAGWLGPAVLVAVDEGRETLDEVLVCTAASCHPVRLGGERVAIVPAHPR
ncbi:hypothetical protein [Catellatospora sichuanensis]|uniref:hypothetical protein n=1 Tax=Catellatospora sichuanensis TaxID=1969805 RepID=UPI0011834296|nr:hypothetical protein [Catellatospora sichuanensis]